MIPRRQTLILLLALAASACDRRAVETPPAPEKAAPAAASVVQAGREEADLTTALSALNDANLIPTLEGGGPWTLFLPLNTTFEALPAAERDALALPENQSALRARMAYHVVAGRLDGRDLAARIQRAEKGYLSLTTLQGAALEVSLGPDGAIRLKDPGGREARVLSSDITASNGLIHEIDAVLDPAATAPPEE